MTGSDLPRILIVDDEKSNRQTLADLLRDDHKVLASKNGEQALASARSDPPPDLILLDVVMPDMDGHAVLRELQGDPHTRHIPVIFITGLDKAHDEEQGLALGAVDYIAKPFVPRVVTARVRNHLALIREKAAAQRAYAELDAANARLAEREQFLNDLIDNSANAIAVRDLTGRYELVNRSWERATGLSRAGVLGRAAAELRTDGARLLVEDPDHDAATLEEGRTVQVEQTVPTVDGQRVLLTSKFPVTGPDGARRGICDIATDITERKAMERQLAEAKDEAEAANQRILESIAYARRIQTGLLPADDALGDAVRELTVRWEPVHTVSGDVYWMERFRDCALIVLADCTGHGVPGAFVTMVLSAALDPILHERGLRSPAAILAALDAEVRARLHQDRPDGDSDDGFDAAVAVLDPATRRLTFAGGGLSFIRVDGRGEATTIRGDRGFLGYRGLPARTRFTEHTLDLDAGSACYLYTDGVTDQVGAATGLTYGRRRMTRCLAARGEAGVAEQVDALMADHAAYQGHASRRDDLTLIGFRPR